MRHSLSCCRMFHCCLGCDFFINRIEPPNRATKTQISSLFGSGALTSFRTEPRPTGNRPTEENNRVAKRAKPGVMHQPAHSFSTKRSEMTMGMCVRSLFVPAQIKYCVPTQTVFLNNQIGSKFLFGYLVGCIFHAQTEHSVWLFFNVEPDIDANPQHHGSSVPCLDQRSHE